MPALEDDVPQLCSNDSSQERRQRDREPVTQCEAIRRDHETLRHERDDNAEEGQDGPSSDDDARSGDQR